MTDLSAQIETLKREVASLRAEVRSVRPFDRLPKNAIVGSDYVKALFGCTDSAVDRGRESYGTIDLRNKRVRFNPDGWLKGDVDMVHQEFIKTAPERAIEAEKAATKRSARRSARK